MTLNLMTESGLDLELETEDIWLMLESWDGSEEAEGGGPGDSLVAAASVFTQIWND